MTIDEKVNEIESRIRSEARVLNVLPLDGNARYLKEVSECISLAGLHCEFGVYRGSSIGFLSSYIGESVPIYGFDLSR